MRLLGLLAMFVVLSLSTGATGETKTKGTGFAAIVEAQFARWDRDRDGKISSHESAELVSNPAITGDEAAAVAAIHIHFRDHPTAPPVAKAELLQGAAKDLPAERRDLANKVQHFGADFGSFRHHIQTAPRELFVGDAPRLVGMKQGHLGDCYFVSTIGAAVQANARRLRSLFHPHPDGSCDLLFLSGHRVTVKKLTDAQIALGSSAGDQGLWLNVLEQSFGQIKLATARNPRPGLSLDVIAKGGDADHVIELLGGHKAEYLAVQKHAHDPRMVAKLRAVLAAHGRGGFLMCAGTAKHAKLPPGVISDHDYAVLSYNPASEAVTVWNPWGQQYEPKGSPPGLEHGYPIKDGQFTVPLHDFVQIYEGVYYETTMPAIHRR